MFRLSENPTRNDVLTFISKSASYGNLGAFIGAGFSKAVLNDGVNDIALSWGELLEQSCKKLGVDYAQIQKEGVGYPDIASAICVRHSIENASSYAKSLSCLKREIAALTSWYPDKDQRERFSKFLNCLSPSWIITTNYDLIIEGLLTGKATPLGPNDSLSSPKGVIPVFHLHGIRTNPEEIIISQEDYVALFRPSEYRQIKLALTIKESTTLLLGYGLGDVNVLTALDWSKNVFKGESVNYPNEVIQVLRKDNPSETPYRDKNGIVIIEASTLAEFFGWLMEVRAKLLEEEHEELKQLNDLAAKLNEPDNKKIEKFIDDPVFRASMLKVLSEFSIHLISSFVSFLDKCIDETWTRSKPYGAFEGYNQNLILIIDILTAFPADKFPPALFETAAYGLQRVGYYVGAEAGKSHAAAITWGKRKTELSTEMIDELLHFANQHHYVYLKKLITTI
jgi:hypothetical protein